LIKGVDYGFFWQKIHAHARKRGVALRVMFELTYRCNFRCRHCYVPCAYQRRYAQLTKKEIFLILDQLKDAGCFYLGFTGGEPLMRGDTPEIIAYAKQKGFEVIVYTNGSLITSELAKRLGGLGLNKVDITIPAVSRRVFRIITGVDARDAVFRGIELLRKEGVPLGFQTCLLEENAVEKKKIEAGSAALRVMHRWDGKFTARLDGSPEPFRYRGKKVRALIARLAPPEDSVCRQDAQLCVEEELFSCGAGWSQAAITPAGELKMCLMIDYPKYSILESSFADCWERLKKLQRAIKPDAQYQCPQCHLQKFCKWCPGMSWLHNRTFTSCDYASRFGVHQVTQARGHRGTIVKKAV